MNGRKYVVVLILIWAIMITWGVYLAFEGSRMVRAEDVHIEDLIDRGMKTYAENCVVCHGANGQGHVGPALNKPEFRGDPDDKKDVFDLIVSTVRDGRPGTTTPRWERVTTGEWASYTAMPMFGSVNGGPFNELYLRALATFIMVGDFRQVSGHIPAPNIPERELALSRMADAASLSSEENRAGKEIFIDRGCVACHAISGIGGATGPDLSALGAWTRLTPLHEWEDFLYDWIEFPPDVVNRAPMYWSNYTGPLPFAVGETTAGQDSAATERQTGTGILDIGGDVGAIDRSLLSTLPLPTSQPLGQTQMPPMPMSDEERATLVKYLARLGR